MDSTSLAPPAGSRIVVSTDDDGQPILSWDPPGGRAGRWATAAFLGFWLCGWFVGEVFALSTLATMITRIAKDGGSAFEWLVGLFLLGWLTGWTVGGCWALRTFVIMIRKPRPETLTFGPSHLRYDPGSFLALFEQEDNKKAEYRKAFNQWRPPPVKDIPWPELGPVRLERVGERQRLSVDWKAERIEIGSTLQEPEREWLAKVLRIWAGQENN